MVAVAVVATAMAVSVAEAPLAFTRRVVVRRGCHGVREPQYPPESRRRYALPLDIVDAAPRSVITPEIKDSSEWEIFRHITSRVRTGSDSEKREREKEEGSREERRGEREGEGPRGGARGGTRDYKSESTRIDRGRSIIGRVTEMVAVGSLR